MLKLALSGLWWEVTIKGEAVVNIKAAALTFAAYQQLDWQHSTAWDNQSTPLFGHSNLKKLHYCCPDPIHCSMFYTTTAL